MKSPFLHIGILVFLIPVFAFTQSITVTGSWILDLTEFDLDSGPGSDLVPTHESASDQIIMRIKKGSMPKLWDWRIDVSRSDLNWPALFSLDIRRTSDGIGIGTISGGTLYQEITDITQSFFYGSGRRKDIDMQLRLRGASVSVEPDTYQTVIIYTIVDM